jgi:hypothetical protein
MYSYSLHRASSSSTPSSPTSSTTPTPPSKKRSRRHTSRTRSSASRLQSCRPSGPKAHSMDAGFGSRRCWMGLLRLRRRRRLLTGLAWSGRLLRGMWDIVGVLRSRVLLLGLYWMLSRSGRGESVGGVAL